MTSRNNQCSLPVHVDYTFRQVQSIPKYGASFTPSLHSYLPYVSALMKAVCGCLCIERPVPLQFDMQQLSLDELKQVLFHAFRDHLTMKDIENIIITEEESLNETSGNCPEYEGGEEAVQSCLEYL